jgi:hypothetical protein
LEVSPTPSNKLKRKAHIILDKPNKKPKSSTEIVIQQNMTKITESAQAFVATRFGGISIEEVKRNEAIWPRGGLNRPAHKFKLFLQKHCRTPEPPRLFSEPPNEAASENKLRTSGNC